MAWLLGGLNAAQKREQRQADFQRALLHYEGRIGSQIFGPVQPGSRREFFCLDEHTWVWHEEWTDEKKQRRVMTTRYDVRPNGILKSQGVNQYRPLARDEETHFRQAVKLYGEQVTAEYRRLLGIA